MLLIRFGCSVLATASFGAALAVGKDKECSTSDGCGLKLASILPSTQALTACQSIAKKISPASAVFYLGAPEYLTGSSHFMLSSSQAPACVFQPGSPADLGIAVKVIGSTRTPFAIQSGGHASNPGFSSTPGVHISMTRLNSNQISGDQQSVRIGVGQVWDSVYSYMQQAAPGRMVVGGRVSGVGVGGFIVGGGGYSWLTNQHGLTVDTLLSFEVVMADGSLATVTSASDSDLFFALKGGSTNFAIVHAVTLKTVPLPQTVWGGYAVYGADKVPALIAATADFTANNEDLNAQLISSFNTIAGVVVPTISVYSNSSTAPAAFAKLLAIPALQKDLSARSYVSLVQSSPSNTTAGQRGTYNSCPVLDYSVGVLQAMSDQLNHLSFLAITRTATFVSQNAEPFSRAYVSHATDSAYPHTVPYFPGESYVAWESPLEDTYWRAALEDACKAIQDVARSEGQDLDNYIRYPNYAPASSELTQLYGTNVARLRAVRNRVDPNGVMKLAGGFKL